MVGAKLHARRTEICGKCGSHRQSFCACFTSDHFSSCLRPPVRTRLSDSQTNLVTFSNRARLRDWVQNSALQTPVIVCRPSILSQTWALPSCVRPVYLTLPLARRVHRESWYTATPRKKHLYKRMPRFGSSSPDVFGLLPAPATIDFRSLHGWTQMTIRIPQNARKVVTCSNTSSQYLVTK